MNFSLLEADPEMKKPRSPRSAYKIFSEQQRAIILQEALKRGELTIQEVTCILNRVKDGQRRKRPGKIGYAEINRRIAIAWKTLSDEKKHYYEIASRKDINRCQLELQAWEELHGKGKNSCHKYSEKSLSQGIFLLASKLDKESIDFICSLNSLSS